MKKVKFSMDCGYVGTEYEEVVEFPDDTTTEEISDFGDEWFWEHFDGGWGFKVLEEEE